MISYMEEERMESLPEEEINMTHAHKEAVKYVVCELVTFFQNNKVRCPFL
jgi:hypothetical protein